MAEIPEKFWNQALDVAEEKGVDPYLLAAIAQHETGFGTLGAGRDGFALGYGVWTKGEPSPKWQDAPGEFTNQLTGAANQIATWFNGLSVSPETLKGFKEYSWKPGTYDQNGNYIISSTWDKSVWKYYESYEKNPALAKNVMISPNLFDFTAGGVLDHGSDPENQPVSITEKVKQTFSSLSSIPGKITYLFILMFLVGLGVFSLKQIFESGGNSK